MTQTMKIISVQELAIYKFQPNNIIMINKTTKHLYEYFQTSIIAPKQRSVFHEHLLQAQFVHTGIIYKKGVTTMQEEISKRMKAFIKQFFQEQELTNTFLPILSCIMYLHSKNIVHGSICPKNIIFNNEGDVLLRDWLLEISPNKYYEFQNSKQSTKNDDIFALAQIMYQTSSLTQFKEEIKLNQSIEKILRKLVLKYSQGYILGIYIMVNKIQKFYPYLQKIFKNEETSIQVQEELVLMYKKIKGQNKVKSRLSPSIKFNNSKNFDIIIKTPLTMKKISKIQDAQNKRTFEDIKSKNYDRLNRIIQKNSSNQLVKKVDMVLKKMSNMKISNLQENDKNFKKIVLNQDVLKFGSPLKRLKTFAKKKAF